ncbi:LPS export ABC transporter periplasmic protein LptC [Orrella daihaiensis]|uniref:LPS export ABC transporter periplasmic protein LptC n=1 Tax=Orrella daihaiensis TaxID=2782176 RepID=A0ABY4AMQ1_9BURK|nr:LPS export ABC transporter periplasmic protein LptC [Orrella daihaiensis]UOD50660.1 LPS export ABC transporter periplasmic protein LptC [Orrella daihaiensis]
MRDRFPTIASVVILAGLVIGTWFAAEHTQRAVTLDAPAKQTHEPDSWGKVMLMLRTDENGVPISRIEGDYMEHFPDDDSYDIRYPRAMSIKPGQPTLVGTSKLATVLDDGNRIIMKQDALVMRLASDTTEPLNVSSNEITLLINEDVAYTDLPATAVRNRSTLKGVGMRYDNKTGELKVFDSTDVEIAPRARQAQPPATEKKP